MEGCPSTELERNTRSEIATFPSTPPVQILLRIDNAIGGGRFDKANEKAII